MLLFAKRLHVDGCVCRARGQIEFNAHIPGSEVFDLDALVRGISIATLHFRGRRGILPGMLGEGPRKLYRRARCRQGEIIFRLISSSSERRIRFFWRVRRVL